MKATSKQLSFEKKNRRLKVNKVVCYIDTLSYLQLSKHDPTFWYDFCKQLNIELSKQSVKMIVNRFKRRASRKY